MLFSLRTKASHRWFARGLLLVVMLGALFGVTGLFATPTAFAQGNDGGIERPPPKADAGPPKADAGAPRATADAGRPPPGDAGAPIPDTEPTPEPEGDAGPTTPPTTPAGPTINIPQSEAERAE